MADLTERPRDPQRLDEAARLYGFVSMPDPATLSPRQMEIIDGIYTALEQRDEAIAEARALVTVCGELRTGRSETAEREARAAGAREMRARAAKVANNVYEYVGASGRTLMDAHKSAAACIRDSIRALPLEDGE